jgi:hypothetical protein
MPSILSLWLLLLAAVPSLPKLVVPNFSDLTVKTRRSFGDGPTTIETLYLKGSRQRTERFSEQPGGFGNRITITQCDAKLRFMLNPDAKTFVSSPIEEWSERIKHAKPLPQPQMSGAEVIVTIDSVDSGETRRIGPYVAHHVKTVQKVEPGPGAVTQASTTETDGWYLDLAGFGCQEKAGSSVGWLTAWSGQRDRVQFKHLGKARHGYAIEETTRQTQDGRTNVSTVELVEFSDKPLDAALFELPSGYAHALQIPHGGFDMTKPDTFLNRLQADWESLKLTASRWFR